MASVTLVTNVHLSKQEAISLLVEVLDAEVGRMDSADLVVVLPKEVEISIEVPKFGEDLPLTLDISGPNHDDVVSASVTVMAKLGQALNWSVSSVGGSL